MIRGRDGGAICVAVSTACSPASHDSSPAVVSINSGSTLETLMNDIVLHTQAHPRGFK